MRRAAVAIALLTLSGCGYGGGAATTTTVGVEASTTSTPTSSTAPTTTVDLYDPRAAILEAHKGFWDTWLAANNPPNPDHPGLRKYYTGEAYETAVASIEKNKREGIIVRLPSPSETHHEVLRVHRIDSENFWVRDCAVDDSQQVRVDTGAVVDDAIVTLLLEMKFSLAPDKTWQVSESNLIEKWVGISRCD